MHDHINNNFRSHSHSLFAHTLSVSQESRYAFKTIRCISFSTAGIVCAEEASSKIKICSFVKCVSVQKSHISVLVYDSQSISFTHAWQRNEPALFCISSWISSVHFVNVLRLCMLLLLPLLLQTRIYFFTFFFVAHFAMNRVCSFFSYFFLSSVLIYLSSSRIISYSARVC